MYAHKVIESIRWLDKNGRYPGSENYFEGMFWVQQGIQAAHHFHIDLCPSIDEMLKRDVDKKIKLFGDRREYMKLPYQVVWFDMEVMASIGADNERTTKIKRAILVTEFEKGIWKILSFYELQPEFSSLAHDINRPLWLMDSIYWQYSFEKNCFDERRYFQDLTQKEINEATRCSVVDMSYFEEFLLLLNCRNVVTETITPSEALNKKRLQNGKPPLYRYKILKVALTDPKVKKGKTEHELTGVHMPLHFCRGHFKEYTQEAPLFGKYAGLWWWQETLRGRQEQGVVDKEYLATA